MALYHCSGKIVLLINSTVSIGYVYNKKVINYSYFFHEQNNFQIMNLNVKDNKQ